METQIPSVYSQYMFAFDLGTPSVDDTQKEKSSFLFAVVVLPLNEKQEATSFRSTTRLQSILSFFSRKKRMKRVLIRPLRHHTQDYAADISQLISTPSTSFAYLCITTHPGHVSFLLLTICSPLPIFRACQLLHSTAPPPAEPISLLIWCSPSPPSPPSCPPRPPHFCYLSRHTRTPAHALWGQNRSVNECDNGTHTVGELLRRSVLRPFAVSEPTFFDFVGRRPLIALCGASGKTRVVTQSGRRVARAAVESRHALCAFCFLSTGCKATLRLVRQEMHNWRAACREPVCFGRHAVHDCDCDSEMKFAYSNFKWYSKYSMFMKQFLLI